MRTMMMSCLLTAGLTPAAALAGECTVRDADVAVEDAWMGKGAFGLEISAAGDAIDTYHYRFRKTSESDGTVNYAGPNFQMTCDTVYNSCDIQARVPQGQGAEILPVGTKIKLEGVVCGSRGEPL